jgi:hypothetical protein
MDCRFPYLVVATAAKEQGVHVYNLQGGPKPFKVGSREDWDGTALSHRQRHRRIYIYGY